MKKSRFTEPQILAILKQGESGVPVPDLYRPSGFCSVQTANANASAGVFIPRA